MSRELQGRVLKNYNGYYYVQTEQEAEPYVCKVKGKMKQNRFSLVTGDLVLLEAGDRQEGMIRSVLPRSSFLPRPTLANLELFVAAFACATPDFSFLLADKLLALAELARVPAVLVLNKQELAPAGLIEQVRQTYTALGYEVFVLSAKEGNGVAALRERLRGRLCAFGGPSGVGKSSTINAIDPSVELRTGDVSAKIGRGKHTTRYAQLLPFDDGYLADTPGFGNLLLEGVLPEQLPMAFREFARYEDGCRFCPCTHTHEPVCGVKQAVDEGRIAATRYASYLQMLQEVKDLQEREGRK